MSATNPPSTTSVTCRAGNQRRTCPVICLTQINDVTGGDGKYRLPVPVPGEYYLGARSGYGGSPVPGDFYGRYEGNPEHAVVLREGETLRGIDIAVDMVR